MICHSRHRCQVCGTTILECRTLAQCRHKDTVKETVMVTHEKHLEMVEADDETTERETV